MAHNTILESNIASGHQLDSRLESHKRDVMEVNCLNPFSDLYRELIEIMRREDLFMVWVLNWHCCAVPCAPVASLRSGNSSSDRGALNNTSARQL